MIPLLLRLWIGRKLFDLLESNVVRVGWHRVIKGPCQLPELAAMQYVAQHTTIPVPTIHSTYTYQGALYIEMEYIEGSNLAVAWMEGDLSADDKKTIIAELKDYVGQLRRLVPPVQGVVASASHSDILDCRIGPRLLGPLSHDEFHAFLRGKVPLENCSKVFGEQVATVHRQHYRTCFSHADLIPCNIMVRGGHIAAIVDWAFAGWYPEYWEFTKAHYDRFPDAHWYTALYDAIPQYDAELAAERALWKQYDEPGIPRVFTSRQ
ncbi:Uncharacterized protein TPAR_03529 [Tolypocladium paradoxum]|uniref:Aminoglycoside phosphotransferase domain-containing protein n=1 Tax=Tolypocladium paradoxum TaxID=94208 RepID=A0A2S4L1E0_9HYPO|nr:Uncharacterized protein TPAR_03529 [Tolypocladium paradoxum]